jgi:hypothetical protein
VRVNELTVRVNLLALAALALVIWLCVALAGCGTAHSAPPPPPAPAAQVASALRLTGFADCGARPVAGVSDSGTARDGSVMIGIDTFAGLMARNTWEQQAGAFGMTPWQQGATWVAYRAQDQSGKACG